MKTQNESSSRETNVSLVYRGVNPRGFWQAFVEAQFSKLRSIASIVSATITLEKQRRSKPAFRVLALVEVPGPDFHAEATGYTLTAALLKAVESLRRQMQSRKNRQVARRKNRAFSPFSSATVPGPGLCSRR